MHTPAPLENISNKSSEQSAHSISISLATFEPQLIQDPFNKRSPFMTDASLFAMAVHFTQRPHQTLFNMASLTSGFTFSHKIKACFVPFIMYRS